MTDIMISVGANTASMQSQLALARASVASFGAQVKEQAQAILAAGSAVDAGMIQQLDHLTHALHDAESAAKKFAEAAHHGMGDDPFANVVQWFQRDMGTIVREGHAMMDELMSGRMRNFATSFSILFFDFAQMNPAIASAVAALGAAGFILEKIAAGSYKSAESVQRLDAAMLDAGKGGGFKVASDQIEELHNQLSISRDYAEQLLINFARMPEVSAQSARDFAVISAAIGEYLHQVGDKSKSLEESGTHAAELFAKALQDPQKNAARLLEEMKLMTPEIEKQIASDARLHTASGMLQFVFDKVSGSLQNQRESWKDTVENMNVFAAAQNALGGLVERFKGLIGETNDTLTQMGRRLDQGSDKLDAFGSHADVATAAMSNFKRALGEVDAVVPAFKKLTTLQGQIQEMSAGLAEGAEKLQNGLGNPSEILKISQALQILRDDYKKTQQDLTKQTTGMSPDEALSQSIAARHAAGDFNPDKDIQDKIAASKALLAADTLTTEERAAETTKLYNLQAEQSKRAVEEQIRGISTLMQADKRGAGERIALLEQEKSIYAAHGMVDQVRQTEERIAEERRRGAEQGASAAKKEAADVLAEAQRAAEGQIQLATLAQEKLKATLDLEVAQRKITQAQEDTLLQAGLDRQYAAQLAELQKELTLQGLKPAQIQGINNKIEEMETQHQIKMLEAQKKTLDDNTKNWQGYFSVIESEFNSHLRGLLSGQEKFGQAAKQVLGDLIIKAIEGLVKWGVEHAAVMAANLAVTTSTTAAGVAVQKAAAATTISGDAAKAAAGAYSAVVQVPIIGPVLAPAAAAVAFGAVEAFGSFDVGGYVLSDGLARIHAGETIVPANVATPYGSGPTGGAAGNAVHVHSPVNIHIAAHDAQGVSDFFHNNSKTMLRAINSAVKNGAHLGLRALRA